MARTVSNCLARNLTFKTVKLTTRPTKRSYIARLNTRRFRQKHTKLRLCYLDHQLVISFLQPNWSAGPVLIKKHIFTTICMNRCGKKSRKLEKGCPFPSFALLAMFSRTGRRGWPVDPSDGRDGSRHDVRRRAHQRRCDRGCPSRSAADGWPLGACALAPRR